MFIQRNFYFLFFNETLMHFHCLIKDAEHNHSVELFLFIVIFLTNTCPLSQLIITKEQTIPSLCGLKYPFTFCQQFVGQASGKSLAGWVISETHWLSAGDWGSPRQFFDCMSFDSLVSLSLSHVSPHFLSLSVCLMVSHPAGLFQLHWASYLWWSQGSHISYVTAGFQGPSHEKHQAS